MEFSFHFSIPLCVFRIIFIFFLSLSYSEALMQVDSSKAQPIKFVSILWSAVLNAYLY